MLTELPGSLWAREHVEAMQGRLAADGCRNDDTDRLALAFRVVWPAIESRAGNAARRAGGREESSAKRAVRR
ncbi:hypothetical protein WS71_00430 [Burkholderia mayonis]|uniref:Uncharacterized protein n=1 Tax=Burkholderia mayonis TaxID=1385591 RepID=A0A1B4FQL7_9BURK|nr:hypothetical protein WS71_00430 [Burkholderia mayonis]KVE54066.1 hypothetical protein WS71_00205 [Burkholderia mayonis]